MPTTGEPIPGENGVQWGHGSTVGGAYGSKRVTTFDKIRTADINQIRDIVDRLLLHTHDYTDQANVTNNGC